MRRPGHVGPGRRARPARQPRAAGRHLGIAETALDGWASRGGPARFGTAGVAHSMACRGVRDR